MADGGERLRPDVRGGVVQVSKQVTLAIDVDRIRDS